MYWVITKNRNPYPERAFLGTNHKEYTSLLAAKKEADRRNDLIRETNESQIGPPTQGWPIAVVLDDHGEMLY